MSTIQITTELYRTIRDQTIKDVIDVLREVISNARDAYVQKGTVNNQADIYWSQDKLVVVDQAIGVPPEKMHDYFLVIGNQTAKPNSRGQFGRGAKDGSALGEVLITCVYNGLISQVIIPNNIDGMRVSISGDQITQTQREYLKIKENGVNYTIVLNDRFKMTDDKIKNYISKISKHFEIRDYIKDGFINLVSHHNGVSYQHTYTPPTGQLVKEILDGRLAEPYSDITYTFRLYRSDTPVGDPLLEDDDRYVKFNVLVRGDHCVYDNTCFYRNEIRFEKNLGYFFGELYCQGIDKMLLETFNHTNDPNTNPFAVVDSGRVNGLLTTHPFVRALYETPYNVLLLAVNDVNDDEEESDLVLSDLSEVLQYDAELVANLSPAFNKVSGSAKEKIVSQITTSVVKETEGLKYSNANLAQNLDSEKMQIIPKFIRKEFNNSVSYHVRTTFRGYEILISTISGVMSKFISYDEMQKDAVCEFTPDTHFTSEKVEWFHKHCA